MNKKRPALYQSWEVDNAMRRFSTSVSIMASRCFSSGCLFSGTAAIQFSREISEISGKIYRQYQQGHASAEAIINALSRFEWELRQQADLVTRFGPETITLMMQHHHGSSSLNTASVYRYAQSEQMQLSHRAEMTRWRHAPHARKNLLLRHVAESYFDERQNSQRRGGGGSGGGGSSPAAASQPEASPKPEPA
ncbi:hypothetical protein [Vibrio quintilis]|uniref:hypothetical protein n=1 Tax=Vibrio quintilis TaxID=1117707 RepID=UPI0011610717|nr:hypothetical protein [Vibrio quintilis]